MTRIALLCLLAVVLLSCTLMARAVTPAPGRGVPASEGSVRFVYVTANDIPFRDDAYAGMDRSAKRIQAWYRSQLAGKSFVMNGPPVETCVLPKPARAYFRNTRDLVLEDVRAACVPVGYNDAKFIWVIYADVDEECNPAAQLGVGGSGLAIMGRNDVQGLGGQASVAGACGGPNTFPYERWVGGTGHELGHALGLPHPPGCDANLSTCDSRALMWAGFYDFPNTYLREDEKALLLQSRFIRP